MGYLVTHNLPGLMAADSSLDIHRSVILSVLKSIVRVRRGVCHKPCALSNPYRSLISWSIMLSGMPIISDENLRWTEVRH